MQGSADDGIELCAGRDGDDEHVALRPGDVVTRETLSRLYCALLSLGDPPDIGNPADPAGAHNEEKV